MYQSYWNKLHKEYFNKDKEVLEKEYLDKFKNLINKVNSKILDLGAGNGNDSLYLRNLNKEVIALDYSDVALSNIKELDNSITTINHDLSHFPYPFKDNEFDLIIADLSLHYFNNETTFKIMNEIKRILKSNGVLLARVNSTNDINYGAKKGIKIEENYYFVDGYNKRFFNYEDAYKYFSIIGEVSINEGKMYRYTKPKEVIEIEVIKK